MVNNQSKQSWAETLQVEFLICCFYFTSLIWWFVSSQTSAGRRMKVTTEKKQNRPRGKKATPSKRSVTPRGPLTGITEWGPSLLLVPTRETCTTQSSWFLLQLHTSRTGERWTRTKDVLLQSECAFIRWTAEDKWDECKTLHLLTLQGSRVREVSLPVLQHRQHQQWIRTQQLRVQSPRRRHRSRPRLFEAAPARGRPVLLRPAAPPGPSGLHRGPQHDHGPRRQTGSDRPPHLQPVQRRAASGSVERARSGPVPPASSPPDRRLHRTSCSPRLSPWQRGRVEPVPAVLVFLLVNVTDWDFNSAAADRMHDRRGAAASRRLVFYRPIVYLFCISSRLQVKKKDYFCIKRERIKSSWLNKNVK